MNVSWYAWVLAAASWLSSTTAQAHRPADRDPHVHAMAVARAQIPCCAPMDVAYHARPIPKALYRFHFSSPDEQDAARGAAWHAYARAMGYTIRDFGPDDLPELNVFVAPSAATLMQDAWASGHSQFVEDIARVAVLAALGGIYVDEGLWPPHGPQGWVDFAAVTPLEGLVLTTDWDGRDIARSSLFATDRLMMAAPGHPVLQHIHDSLEANHEALVAQHLGFWPPYDGGAFVLNRALAGTMTVVSIRTWNALGVLGDGAGARALLVE